MSKIQAVKKDLKTMIGTIIYGLAQTYDIERDTVLMIAADVINDANEPSDLLA